MSKQNKIWIGERVDLRDFPEIIRNGNLGDLETRSEYEAAKHGVSGDALDMAESIVSPI
ncbi:hypothetical protein C8R34_10597 [Nitrosomonas sp. Nm84]|uniref:hypothetical protein n=1 Tax=Nitrosomonas sp. Nm84 TaxID=200124 RepID=UPI000D9EEB2D|nr:hypothetical protein [Nitrosomonas sp. Nm84]PXW89116.1 hypothetical protein C8R34_10597 [Nitrosomonas sp. Nm84]